MSIRQEIQSLAPSALLELFILDTTNMPGGSVMRFHAGTNGLSQPVVWQGQTYEPLPIEATGFDVTTKGSAPRPKIKIANVNGLLSASVKSFNDFVGCKLTRKRTFAKYLDEENFPARRNLLTHTSAPTANTWVNNGLTIIGTTESAPDGSLTASLTSQFNATRYTGVPGLAGAKYTYSLHVKPENDKLPVRIYVDGTWGAGGAFTAAYVDIVPLTGQKSVAQGAVSASGVVPMNDGWYRLWMTFTPQTAGTINCHMYPISDQYHRWYGFQLEDDVLTDYQEIGQSFRRNATADPNQYIADDIWFVEQKVSENRYVIEFELSSAFDLMGHQLPSRQIIQNSCPWRYRSAECGYAGAPFDANNNPATPLTDVCAKTLSACRIRFGTQPVRFGGFPGAVRGTQ
jgi:phage-related protein